MATRLGVNATKLQNNIPQLAEQGEQAGRLHVMYDEYAAAGAMTSGDIIKIGGLLPAGARVIDAVIDSPDLDSASAGAMTLGWAASSDGVEAASAAGLLSSLDVHTAGKTLALSGLLQSVCVGKYKKFASPVQVQIAITGNTDTAGTVRCAVYYIID